MEASVKQILVCPSCGATKLVKIECLAQRFYSLYYRLDNLAVPYDEENVTVAGDSDSSPMLCSARCSGCGYRFKRHELQLISAFSEDMDYDDDQVIVDECRTCQFAEIQADWNLLCKKKNERVPDQFLCDDYKEYKGRER